MATLHLICGLPCAGKTTLAKQLERDLPGLRLAADEWMARIVKDKDDSARRDAVEATQWDIAVRAVALGIDAILENGFWTRAERDQLRLRASASGITLQWYSLDVPLDELLRRLSHRNASLPPDTFPIEESELRSFAKWWQPITPDELAGTPPRSASRNAE